MKEITLLVLTQMFMMGICMAFGYLCYRINAFGDGSIREFASLIMRYTIPLSIALSFKEQFQVERIVDWGQVFFYSCLGFGFMIVLMTIAVPKTSPNYQQKRLCGLIPNNAIFGLVIAQSLFGAEGVFLVSSQIVVSNLLLWTYGITILSKKPKLRNVILNPALLGVLAGIALVIIPFDIPTPVYVSLEKLTNINAPIGLMLAGAYIARISIGHCFRSISYYQLALWKLIVGPMLIVPVLLLLHIDRTIALVVLIGLIAPTGTAVATFTEMAGMDNAFSSGSVAFNEVACIITIPLMLTLLMNIF